MNTQIETQNFHGTVILKEWMSNLEGTDVKRVTGTCSLVKDEDIAGFKTRGTESNWGIRVVGETEQWTILGCQIRAVVAHPEGSARSGCGGHVAL